MQDLDRSQPPVHDEIERLAHDLYEARDPSWGDDPVEDWLAAERQLLEGAGYARTATAEAPTDAKPVDGTPPDFSGGQAIHPPGTPPPGDA